MVPRSGPDRWTGCWLRLPGSDAAVEGDGGRLRRRLARQHDAVGPGDFDRGVLEQLHLPTGLVGEVVMVPPAQHQEVRLVRGSAVLPGHDVVGLTPGHRLVATRKPAT